MLSLADKLRPLKGRLRRLPDFIIIGAQRAGTSSLFSYLEQHPQIEGSSRKEVHYFDVNYHRGESWYRSFFPVAVREGADLAVGEASPYYIIHPWVPGRIHDLIPDVKLIALLRNPTERAISHFFHEVALGNETLPLEEAIRAEEARIRSAWERLSADGSFRSRAHQSFSYRQRGLYEEQLRRFHAVFSRDQLLVLDSGALFRSPLATLSRILEFLGVNPDFDQFSLGPKNKGTYTEKVPARLVKELEAYFAPHNRSLFDYLGEEFEW